MKWFKHDSDASTDAKIKKLIIRHGAIGYAVYFHCLELISADVKESNLTFELEHDSEIIADNLKIQGDGMNAGVDIVNSIMRTIINLNLFQSSGEKIFCIKLAKRLDSSMTSNPAFRQLIQKSHDLVMIPSVDSHDTVMQEETRLEEIIKEETIIKEKEEKENEQPFEQFNPQHQRKQTAKNKFSDLTNYWNEKVPQQQTPFTALNMSLSGDIITLLDNTDISVIRIAIDHYGQAYEHNKYRVAGFTNFMTIKNVETWFPESSVENRKSGKEEKEPEKITEEQKKRIEEIEWN